MKRLFYIIPLILLFVFSLLWGIRKGQAEETLANGSVVCLSCIGLK